MKQVAGLALVLFTGCTGVSVRPHAPGAVPLPPSWSHVVRVGVEYLPPHVDLPATAEFHTSLGEANDVPRDPQRSLVVSPRPLGLPTEELDSLDFEGPQLRWDLRRENIRTKRSSIERFTLRFLSELIGDDRKRVQRAIGPPLLGSQQRRASDPLSNFLDERDAEDHQQLLTRNGTRMIRRPLRNAIKELPLFHDVEFAIHKFKSDNVSYQRRKSRKLGRISMRLRASRLDDPVELRWIYHGLRIGSSMDHLKVSFNTNITPDLSLRFRSRFNYNESGVRVLGTLEYKLNKYTTINALAGNRVNTLSGAATYPGGPQSDEKTKAVLFYVEHQF